MPNFVSPDGDLASIYVSNVSIIDQYVKTGLWSWGYNFNGMLGDGTTADKSSPVKIGSDTTWNQVSGGSWHTAAVKSDGSLWTWGYQSASGINYVLGTGNLTNFSSPVQTAAGGNDWKTVSSGFSLTAAIKNNGTIWSWGTNTYGQLGNGTVASLSVPTQMGAVNTWIQVASGGYHAAAIKSDGTLWVWGRNNQGQLGLGDTTSTSTPVQVGVATNWKYVTTGQFACAAIKTDGTLWAWGYNNLGQLGLGDVLPRSTPVQVGVSTNWVQVSTALNISSPNDFYHTGAINSNGELYMWGFNSYGNLGDGTTTSRSTPVQVGSLTDWKQVSCNIYMSGAVKTDGTLWTWGYGGTGALGDGTTTAARSSPVQTISYGTSWKQVTTRYTSTSAITYNY